MIDANFERLSHDYPLDPYRTPFEGADPFLASSDELKRFSKRHGERLLELIEEAFSWRQPLGIDCVSRTANGATLRIVNHGDDTLDLGAFQLAFKRGDVVRFRSLKQESPLGPGASRDLVWEGMPNRGGLALVLSRGRFGEDDFDRIPLDFCFAPEVP